MWELEIFRSLKKGKFAARYCCGDGGGEIAHGHEESYCIYFKTLDKEHLSFTCNSWLKKLLLVCVA